VAYQELLDLKQIMVDNPVSVQPDVWSNDWGPTYTAALFYRRIHAHIKTPSVYKWLWKSCCMMRHKMFAWLLLSDHINTRDFLQRRHWHVQDDTHCELYPGHLYEDRAHLFFDCQFSRQIWNYLKISWNSNDSVQAVVSEARRSFGHPFSWKWSSWRYGTFGSFEMERSLTETSLRLLGGNVNLCVICIICNIGLRLSIRISLWLGYMIFLEILWFAHI
jgi:hypothetical protein